MVSDTATNPKHLHQTEELREQARELLNRLVANRESSERRLAEAGKNDPIRSITGRTALESAIASTHEMVRQMDQLVSELRGNLGVNDVGGHRPARLTSRSAPKVVTTSFYSPKAVATAS